MLHNSEQYSVSELHEILQSDPNNFAAEKLIRKKIRSGLNSTDCQYHYVCYVENGELFKSKFFRLIHSGVELMDSEKTIPVKNIFNVYSA